MSQIDDEGEEAESRWWGRGSYGGLAQHSGSAGNSNLNHFSAPHAYFYMLVDPCHHHGRSASGSSLRLYQMCAGLCVCVCLSACVCVCVLGTLAIFLTEIRVDKLPRRVSS